MATYYAWSRFVAERNEWGQNTKTIEPGETVTAKGLNVSQDEFDSLIEAGAVREMAYPKDLAPNVSPAEYWARQDALLATGQLSDDESKEVMKRRAAMSGAEQVQAQAASQPKDPVKK